MRALELQPNGRPSGADLAPMGGAYGFLEALRLRGTGSGKVVYAAGVASFDRQRRGIEGELPIANFELLRAGLLLWVNVGQRVACAGTPLASVEEVVLERQTVEMRAPGGVGLVPTDRPPPTYRRGVLYVRGEGFEVAAVVIPREYGSVRAFFGKRPIRYFFREVDVGVVSERDYSGALASVSRLLFELIG